MFKACPFKILFLPILLICVLILNACKSSEFADIFGRCAPNCTSFESPVPTQEVKNSFLQAVANTPVSEADLNGRWVMLSASRYTVSGSTQKSFTDLLFTKSMVFTDFGNEVQVSDCYNSETYPLNDSGFTIPKDSIFFSSLYFENQSPIIVNKLSNKSLRANWTFTTPQNTQANVEINMYKVSDSNSATTVLGKVNSIDNIYCYSYLHAFTSGEQLFGNQWIPGENEVKEMLLKIDPLNGDENIALSSSTINRTTSEYKIIFNKDIEFEEYECFGTNSINNTADDYLSFSGSFNIIFLDIDCNKSLGENLFSFLIK